ncbi:unnamed protein product [Durusdinium trenchii]|uniref:Uncharacterized protein n=1 Tax=Durusdinium trenchii TaxID=1381693 RepID=A0ABP0S1A6_9DINO
MRYLPSLLASTFWHVVLATPSGKRYITVAEDGRLEPLLRSETKRDRGHRDSARGRIPGSLQERQVLEAFLQEDELELNVTSNTTANAAAERAPVNCEWSNWTNWTSCSATCGGGRQKRTRAVKHREEDGGEPCQGNATEERACDTQVCSRDCVWTAWDSWAACSATCESGTASRSREVKSPKQGEGRCEGNSSEVRNCQQDPCPQDCQFSDWDSWTSCIPFCDGQQKRNRSKTVENQFGGSCGELEESRSCTNFCLDCQWSDWSQYSACSKTCGGGESTRWRNQNFAERGKSKLPGYSSVGSGICPGHYDEVEIYPEGDADHDRVTCGLRCREDPRCAGFALSTEPKRCLAYNISALECQIEGTGQRYRKDPWKIVYGYQFKRNLQCTAKPKQKAMQSRQEAEAECSKDSSCKGFYSPKCNESVVLCLDMADQEANGGCVYEKLEIGGGEQCTGTASEVTACNSQICSVDCVMSEWTDWTPCEKCTQVRRRNVTQESGAGVPCGKTEEEKPCGTPCVDCSRSECENSTEVSQCTQPGNCSTNCTWEDWNDWTVCSASCGEGSRVRFRLVAKEAVGPHGAECTGKPKEEEYCDPGSECPVDCAFNDWKEWGPCEAMPCGAKKVRARTQQPALYGGKACDGNTSQEEECIIPDAKIVECDENGKPVTTTTTTTITSISTTTLTTTTTTITSTQTTTTTSANITSTVLNDSASAAIAATVTVEGTEVLEVSNANDFVKDTEALEAIREAIAQEAQVSTDAVVIISVTIVQESGASLLSLGSRPRRKRLESPSGRVEIKYEIMPLNKTVDQVLDTLDQVDTVEAVETFETALAHHNAKYVVEVSSSETKAVSKEDGHTVREVHLDSAASPLVLPFVPVWLQLWSL